MMKYWLVTDNGDEAPSKWELFEPQNFDELMVLMEIIWISENFVFIIFEDGEWFDFCNSKQEFIDYVSPATWITSEFDEIEDIELPF